MIPQPESEPEDSQSWLPTYIPGGGLSVIPQQNRDRKKEQAPAQDIGQDPGASVLQDIEWEETNSTFDLSGFVELAASLHSNEKDDESLDESYNEGFPYWLGYHLDPISRDLLETERDASVGGSYDEYLLDLTRSPVNVSRDLIETERAVSVGESYDEHLLDLTRSAVDSRREIQGGAKNVTAHAIRRPRGWSPAG